MAFTGIATVAQVSDNKFRITGLSLAGDASGTIGFSDKAVPAEVSLEAPEWLPFKNGREESVSLQQAIEVRIALVSDVTAPVPISVVKTGTDHSNFAITLHNDTAATASAELEIWVSYH